MHSEKLVSTQCIIAGSAFRCDSEGLLLDSKDDRPDVLAKATSLYGGSECKNNLRLKIQSTESSLLVMHIT